MDTNVVQFSRPEEKPKRQRKPDKIEPWKHKGVLIGYIRNGVYWIDQYRGADRHRLSTKCRTEGAAWAEYEKWEKHGPAQYAQPGVVREGAGWKDACEAFLKYQINHAGRSLDYVEEQAGQLEMWGRYKGFESLDSFGQAQIEAFLNDLMAGKLTGRRVNARDAAGNVIYERDEVGNIRRDEKGRQVAVKVLVSQKKLDRKATRNRYLAALKALMKWARSRRPALTTNEADKTVPLAKERHNTRPRSAIQEKVWQKTQKHLIEKWALAQTILLGSGMRWTELARLTDEDPLWRTELHDSDVKDEGVLFIRITKGGEGREVPVSKEVTKAVRALVKIGGIPQDKGNQMKQRLEAACRAAGVPRYTAHFLRHTFATECLRNGIDPRTLQVWMGHKDLATTMKYLHALKAREGARGFAPV